VPEAARAATEALLERRAEVLAWINGFVLLDSGIGKIRHHGDLHLGQVLIVKDDVYIIDFEGEPDRPLEWRRRKAPAARDLAGLVRSIDYASEAALDRLVPGAPEDRARLIGRLDDWRNRCIETFLSAYRETAADSRLWPQDAGTAERLLGFFTMEKVIYEVGYELANRPSWLHVPLAGALRLLFPPENAAR
jgi:maltose alpha-D-glucosyltransferase/alpha-amylase